MIHYKVLFFVFPTQFITDTLHKKKKKCFPIKYREILRTHFSWTDIELRC